MFLFHLFRRLIKHVPLLDINESQYVAIYSVMYFRLYFMWSDSEYVSVQIKCSRLTIALLNISKYADYCAHVHIYQKIFI